MTVLIWALVGWSATYWVLSVSQGTVRPLSGGELVATEAASSDVQAVARALGTTAPAATASGVTAARYRLLGVAAGHQGVALIALDDQPGRPYRLHATLAEGVQVVALGPDTATLRLSDGQLLNLRVSAMPQGAAAAPPELPMAINNEQVQAQAPAEAVVEYQTVRERKGDSGRRTERAKEGLSSDAELTSERLN